MFHFLSLRNRNNRNASHDPYQAWRSRGFQYYFLGSLLGSVGYRMQSAAVGWDIYARTHSAMALGFVGLAQALPVLLLSLPAGQFADRFNRQHIVIFVSLILAMVWTGLYFASAHDASIGVFYFLLFLDGIANAFIRPARNSFITQLVPLHVLPNAITWNSSRMQISGMVGPALGGLAIAALAGPATVYLITTALSLIYVVCMFLIRPRPQEYTHEKISLRGTLSGARFVFNNKLLLAPLTLDMLAVLFGGAQAIMPIFAKDILHVDSLGYGLLLAAPGMGALLTLLFIAHIAEIRSVGKVLLWSVAGYGVAMIVFGFSKSFWLSMSMLFLSGGLDSVSVMIRHSLVQMVTPDFIRGRVTAINGIFIGVSNELGGFESGAIAKLIGPVLTVVFGGITTILVVAGVAWRWPQLKRLSTLAQAGNDALQHHEEWIEKYIQSKE